MWYKLGDMSHVKKEVAIETLKKMFSNTPEDVIEVDDIYKAWERSLEDEKNKVWLANKLTDLKYYNLVKSNYSFKSGYRSLVNIQLTMEGKKALRRIGDIVIQEKL